MKFWELSLLYRRRRHTHMCSVLMDTRPPPPHALCAAGNANLAYIVGKSEKSSAKKKNVLC